MQVASGSMQENGAANEVMGSESGSEEEGTSEEEPDVKASVAGVVQALTELVSVQTPASVWLPNKHLTLQHSGKVHSWSIAITESRRI